MIVLTMAKRQCNQGQHLAVRAIVSDGFSLLARSCQQCLNECCPPVTHPCTVVCCFKSFVHICIYLGVLQCLVSVFDEVVCVDSTGWVLPDCW